jgi:threonine dehydrogenase-like Zn-dependent dehydrogenase
LKNYPLILGHEGVGRVIEKGGRVRNFQIGDIVLHTQLDSGSDLIVASGEKPLYLGWGGLVEFAQATDWKALHEDGVGSRDPRLKPVYYAQRVLRFNLDPVLATPLITWREVVSAIKQFGFNPNSSIVIFGDGPVGLSLTLFCKLWGLYPVILCGHHRRRLELAAMLGADRVVNTRIQDPDEAIREILPGGCDSVVDAVGNAEIVECALRLVKHEGKVFVYGILQEGRLSLKINDERVPGNFQIRSYQEEDMFCTGEAHQQVENLLRSGCIDPKIFVTHTVPLERIVEGLDIVQKREGIKVVIKFDSND